MKDQNLIELINQHMAFVKEAYLSKNENLEHQHLEKVFEIYERLSYKTKISYQEYLYVPLRNMGRFYFTSNNYNKSVEFITRAQSLKEYNNDLFDNKFRMQSLLLHSFTMLYLENSDDNSFLDKANLIIKTMRETEHLLSDKEYLQEFNKREEIYHSVMNGEVYTSINLELPFPLVISEKEIEFEYLGTACFLHCEIVKSLYNYFQTQGNGFFEIVEDKYGLANRSKITIKINKYIHPDTLVRLDTLAESNNIYLALATSINILNYFIERFRIVTEQYWIETVNHKMVSKFDFCITAGSHNIRTVVWTDSSVYRSHPTMPWIDSEKQAYLATKLLSNTIPIWEHLILDAKDYLLRDRSRESLISLNSAFENFISIYCKNHLMKTMSQEEADDYIMGKPMYKDFFLMNYLSEEAYNAALQNGDITNFPPQLIRY